jgi:hypothetical protein
VNEIVPVPAVNEVILLEPDVEVVKVSPVPPVIESPAEYFMITIPEPPEPAVPLFTAPPPPPVFTVPFAPVPPPPPEPPDAVVPE